ncbi:hypothetical protein UY3_02344 [Chelonia mydas]|uniref:Uncharacterized protein n=1 Tax=Chelonia mydas TaxID=8469 RepID=M7BTB0_CHEMY|nr:hypothetical protein UY3_02344 [Chelonia mydas]
MAPSRGPPLLSLLPLKSCPCSIPGPTSPPPRIAQAFFLTLSPLYLAERFAGANIAYRYSHTGKALVGWMWPKTTLRTQELPASFPEVFLQFSALSFLRKPDSSPQRLLNDLLNTPPPHAKRLNLTQRSPRSGRENSSILGITCQLCNVIVDAKYIICRTYNNLASPYKSFPFKEKVKLTKEVLTYTSQNLAGSRDGGLDLQGDLDAGHKTKEEELLQPLHNDWGMHLE